MADEQPSDERALMEEQRRILSEQTVLVSQVSQIDKRLIVVETRLPALEMAMKDLAEAQAAHVRQGTLNEAAILAIKEGTEALNRHVEDIRKEHNEEMKEMKRDQIDTGKIMSGLSIRVNVLWGAVGVIATAFVGVLISKSWPF